MFILDKDPITSARSLISVHVRYYMLDVMLVFRMYYNPDEKRVGRYKTLYNFISYSKKNYQWWVDFYKELQEIYKDEICRKKTYHKLIKGFDESMLEEGDED